MSIRNPLVVVLGATGTGKTKLAVELCKRFGGELLNTDSMQIYKGLDISTNKATDEEMQGVKQHMMAFLEPAVTGFNVIQFRDMILSKIRQLWDERKLPVIVGGTSYYIEAVLWRQLIKDVGATDLKTRDFKDWYTEGLPPDVISLSNEELHDRLRDVDAATAAQLHPNLRRRVLSALQTYYRDGKPLSEFISEQKEQDGASALGGSLRFDDVLMFYLDTHDWPALVKRLDHRVDEMVERGLERELTEFYDTYHEAHVQQLDEVKEISPDVDDSLLESEYTKGVFQSIGLKEFRGFLSLSPDDRQSDEGRKRFARGVELLKIATRQYARRQQRYVKNRLLKHPERNLPPMYEFDVTDASEWETNVRQPSQAIAQCFVDDIAIPVEFDAYKCVVADKDTSDEHRQLFAEKLIRCKYCSVITNNEHSWRAHARSKSHRHVRSKYLRTNNMSMDFSLDDNGRELVVPEAEEIQQEMAAA